jgi:hypothetical protein
MVGTMGVALSVGTLPGQVTSDRLGPGKMELGLGIVSHFHGVIAFLVSKEYWASFWVDYTRVHALLYLHIYHNAIMFLLHMRERRGVWGFLSWVESFWCHAFHLIAVQFSCHILLIFSAVYLLHFDFWLHIYKLNFKNTFSF